MLLAAGLLAACTSGDDAPEVQGTATSGLAGEADGSAPTTTPATTVAPPAALPEPPTGPEGDAFYEPPAVGASSAAASAAGDPIWTRPVAVADGVDARLLLHWTTGVDDAVRAASAVVLVPAVPADGPRPVVVVAPGTQGLADDCATSRQAARGGLGALGSLASVLLDRGWVVAVTDYQGLGTPGEHPYGVAAAGGRDVLALAEAVTRTPSTGATPESAVAVWGHAQGGAAAVLAAELQPTVAPDVRLTGVAAGAVPSDLGALATALAGGPYAGYVLMVSAGFDAAYPSLGLLDALTPEGRDLATAMRSMCGGEALGVTVGGDPAAWVPAGVLDRADVAGVLAENEPGAATVAAPLLLYHGDLDEQIPLAEGRAVHERVCAAGGASRFVVQTGADHLGSVAMAAGQVVDWLADRLDGGSAPTGC